MIRGGILTDRFLQVAVSQNALYRHSQYWLMLQQYDVSGKRGPTDHRNAFGLDQEGTRLSADSLSSYDQLAPWFH